MGKYINQRTKNGQACKSRMGKNKLNQLKMGRHMEVYKRAISDDIHFKHACIYSIQNKD